MADRIDLLLGGKRTDDNKSESTLRLTLAEKISERHTPEFSMDAGFILKLETLDRMQSRVQNWFDKQWQDLEDGTADLKSSQNGSRSARTKDPWRFSVDKHLSLGSQISFQIYPRLRKDIEMQYLLHTFLIQAGWSIRDQWDSQATWVSSVKARQSLLITWTNSWRWKITDRQMSTTHGPGFSYLISDRQALTGLAALNTDISTRSWGTDSYIVSVTYRFAALKEWLFISINPFVNFLRTERFYRDFGFTLSTEMVF